ncbi:hypothetical protein SK571_45585 [Lentzea sp. BCCO 10_0798]|uniref:Transcriptional regulator, HxlR family n=1 Tax=Lentzea kristufekii TaxID=3095430 RepID=A0ABU4U8J9_9PSEU|nr:hypothetical protein [Lentzea sp. BCCO 10_0798]MDX8056685.1 hypothetical protein [Lentzea sp. BCCO 10_0798]
MTETPQTTPAASTPDTSDIPSMRGALGQHALVRDERPPIPGPITRDSQAFRELADDLPVRRVLWMLASGMTWPWVLESVTTPAARNRAIRRGLMAPPVGEADAVLVPYHLTDAGRAELLDWVARITPHRHLPEVDALWRMATWK